MKGKNSTKMKNSSKNQKEKKKKLVTERERKKNDLPIRAEGGGGLASGSVAAGIVFWQLTNDDTNVDARGRVSSSS